VSVYESWWEGIQKCTATQKAELYAEFAGAAIATDADVAVRLVRCCSQ